MVGGAAGGLWGDHPDVVERLVGHVLPWRRLPPGLRQTQQASDPLASGLTQLHSRTRVVLRVEVIQMNVLAVSTPGHPNWRWRIVGYYGEMVEESSASFPTIAQAVAEGRERLQRHTDRDAPIVRRPWARTPR